MFLMLAHCGAVEIGISFHPYRQVPEMNPRQGAHVWFDARHKRSKPFFICGENVKRRGTDCLVFCIGNIKGDGLRLIETLSKTEGDAVCFSKP